MFIFDGLREVIHKLADAAGVEDLLGDVAHVDVGLRDLLDCLEGLFLFESLIELLTFHYSSVGMGRTHFFGF